MISFFPDLQIKNRTDRAAYAVLVIRRTAVFRECGKLLVRVRHGIGLARRAQQLDIVEVIAEGHAVRRRDAERAAQLLERPALAHAGPHEVDPVRARERELRRPAKPANAGMRTCSARPAQNSATLQIGSREANSARSGTSVQRAQYILKFRTASADEFFS